MLCPGATEPRRLPLYHISLGTGRTPRRLRPASPDPVALRCCVDPEERSARTSPARIPVGSRASMRSGSGGVGARSSHGRRRQQCSVAGRCPAVLEDFHREGGSGTPGRGAPASARVPERCPSRGCPPSCGSASPCRPRRPCVEFPGLRTGVE